MCSVNTEQYVGMIVANDRPITVQIYSRWWRTCHQKTVIDSTYIPKNQCPCSARRFRLHPPSSGSRSSANSCSSNVSTSSWYLHSLCYASNLIKRWQVSHIHPPTIDKRMFVSLTDLLYIYTYIQREGIGRDPSAAYVLTRLTKFRAREI